VGKKHKHAPETTATADGAAVDGAVSNLGAKLPKSFYVDELNRLRFELVRLQYWVKERGERVVVLFEGRDAAGKGGTIKRIAEPLNPRGVRLVALGKPSDVERTQWYFQRYVARLPTAGEIVRPRASPARPPRLPAGRTCWG
jgi:polyphosphate kinase